ncbi:hypothetical protein [Metabacillus fastidiosus]|uniref:YozE SAM-like domain-containing protein n=1 Tax=Metabacillus fastidiosus TaxID=1458 RepID=A0ABU6NS54_9BACI|nr:hypothetical protein [Metabacillus fastidiosus]
MSDVLYDIGGFVSHCINEEKRVPTSTETKERFAADLTIDDEEMIIDVIKDFIAFYDMTGINNEFEKERLQ